MQFTQLIWPKWTCVELLLYSLMFESLEFFLGQPRYRSVTRRPSDAWVHGRRGGREREDDNVCKSSLSACPLHQDPLSRHPLSLSHPPPQSTPHHHSATSPESEQLLRRKHGDIHVDIGYIAVCMPPFPFWCQLCFLNTEREKEQARGRDNVRENLCVHVKLPHARYRMHTHKYKQQPPLSPAQNTHHIIGQRVKQTSEGPAILHLFPELLFCETLPLVFILWVRIFFRVHRLVIQRTGKPCVCTRV